MLSYFFFLIIRRPPRSTRTDTLFPYTTLFRSANMMLIESTRALKLMDFGIARITDSSKTKTGLVLGTPSYMSPEQLAGRKVDGRSDLFSLGVTPYQLLTGALPFQAESMDTLLFKIATEPHAPLLRSAEHT